MKKTIEMLEARINLLKQRGEMMNQGIINKIKREIRKIENESRKIFRNNWFRFLYRSS